MRINKQVTIVRSTAAVETTVGSEVVLMILESGECLGLGETGSDVWRLLANSTQLDPLVASLNETYQAPPNNRHVGDIDILTQPIRLPEQIALLSQFGYQIINPKSHLTPRRIASCIRFWKDFTFQSCAAGFELDLHQQPLPPRQPYHHRRPL